MPQLIKPSEVKILTQDGEVRVSITLDLNINLNQAGGADVAAMAHVDEVKAIKKKKEETQWEIPDFENAPKINFGKKS